MNRINKFLKKVDKKDRNKIFVALGKIILNELEGLDLKKLDGHKNLYRYRTGRIRIIFSRQGNHYIPIDINYRKNIYKGL